jgi:Xaa-Pro aminopeptidase
MKHEVKIMKISERIAALRKLMKDRKIDVYYIPNEDDHLSEEYTADHFKCKSYMSGFSGDAGCTIVTKDFAGLWTDGRYFTQAEDELKGTGVTLMRLHQEGVPNPIDFVIEETPKNGLVGFDGSVVSASAALGLSAALKQKGAAMHVSEDLVDMVWQDRPGMPQEPLFILPKKYTGEDAKTRIDRVRQDMKEKKASVMILTMLEDPCWLLNLRGNDIPCTPVAYAFALITNRKVSYYVAKKQVTKEVREYLKKNGVTVRPYESLALDLSKLHKQTIWADLRSLNTKLYAQISSDNQIYNALTPIMRYRSVKNKTEIRNLIHAHVKDGAAMVKFLRYVKETAPKGTMTELSAQNKLYELRAEGKEYIEPSFDTIAAYQANGAMMHYTATEEKFSKVAPKGFLLVDSGGTYKDGTTDITRTIAVGPLTAKEKTLYTKVLQGHLALMRPHFLQGTTGNNLDILAREPLWNMNIDYQCGTGHGVGHVLGVHEGVHGVRWGMPTASRPSAPFEAGMIVTDEPGIYLPHKLGIRIENELLVVPDGKNFYGHWLKFQNVTYCPYDRDAIEPALLNDEELAQINAYHAEVRKELTPYLKGKDLTFLRKATAAIKR